MISTHYLTELIYEYISQLCVRRTNCKIDAFPYEKTRTQFREYHYWVILLLKEFKIIREKEFFEIRKTIIFNDVYKIIFNP